MATLAQPGVGAVEFAVSELGLEVGGGGVEEDLGLSTRSGPTVMI
jgi:hypothetical protein